MLLLRSECCADIVTGIDLVVRLKKAELLQGVFDFLKASAGKIRSADSVSEKGTNRILFFHR